MSEKLLERLEKYREAISEEKINRVNEIGKKYEVHKLSNSALEACLLQVPLIEIWLSLILEHKLFLVQYENLERGQYFDLQYKNKSYTTLNDLIKVYKMFFPDFNTELDLFNKRRNNLSHFLYENKLPEMSDVAPGDELISSLREINQGLYKEIKLRFKL